MDSPDQSALEDLFEPRTGPVKTYGALLASGIRHQGGLAMLAAAEAKGLLLSEIGPRP